MAVQGTTSAPASAGDEFPDRRNEIFGIIATAATILVALSLFSYDSRGGENLIGPIGIGIASVLGSAFGVVAWVVPVELGLLSARLFRRRSTSLGPATVASTFVIVFVGCALLHLVFRDVSVFGGHLVGGALGEVIGEVSRSLLGDAGAYVVCISVLLITLILRTRMSLMTGFAWLQDSAALSALKARDGAGAVADAWREARSIDSARDELDDEDVDDDDLDDDEDLDDQEDEAVDEVVAPKKKRRKKKVDADDGSDTLTEEEEPAAKKKRAAKKKKSTASTLRVEDDELEEIEDEPAPKKKRAAKPKAASGPKIVAPVPVATKKSTGIKAHKPKKGEFHLPPVTLLSEREGGRIRVDAETLRDNARRLTEKLASYGVKGRVDEIHPGPVVTMYEFEPASGTKISKIAGLENDLALALAAQKVRIVAPIPGKARVGIELPNDDRQTVFLREIVEDERWAKHKGSLPIALGKDIAGQSVYTDLAKMPHLLVAGATGAGKSVGLNVMLVSLLSKKTPEEVRLLMIDPKVVELAVFDGIPHMLLPVVTDMKKAALSLRWAVDEMERRYQLFADAGARSIGTYNKKVQRVIDGDLAPEKLTPKRKGKVKAQGPGGEEVLLPTADGERADAMDELPTKLPYVVVVVDEFADLMMVAAKDVEACIARLAQKARAAGIHVILATQRPSVDVITGMIKANFPSRMAFKVSQREDSKTILGRVGAQNLLGRGDMLMLPPGQSELQRVHCAYISEEEVSDVCDFLREQGEPVYDENILKPREEGEGGKGKTDDPLYDKAVAVVAQAGYCSISALQRALGIGYNKAAKLVDRMEAEGVVGPAPAKAGKRREVLISPL